MPLYDYHCTDCGDFRYWCPMSESDQDTACPDCDQPATRLVTAPSLALMPNNNRIANARNEKSADQPEMITRNAKDQGSSAHHHPHTRGGHGHSHSHGRPWMIGH